MVIGDDGKRQYSPSVYPEYQERAVKLGAVQGFGKSSVGAEETRELLRGVLVGAR